MIEWILLISSLIILMIASDQAVTYLLKLSKIFGISEMSAGFIILSLSTSLPELFVSINSAIVGQGSLAVGNVLGSNIANLTIILGLAVIISNKRKISFNQRVFDNLTLFLFTSSLIPLLILQTGSVSLLLGIVLIGLFIVFAIKTPTKIKDVEDIDVAFKKNKYSIIVKFVLAIIFVILSSNLLVSSSLDIVESMGIPPSLMGATLIALGTSLPELTTIIQAFRKGLFDVGLGGAIGSCITNLTLILGITSIFNSVQLNILSFTSIILYSIMSSLITWYFISTGRTLDKKESFLLIGLYLLFILQQLGFSIFIF